MAQAFDAYQAWLGIAPQESANGGPNHYRLLGLLVFESNPALIENAANRAAAHVRGFQNGPYKLVATRVLGEIAAARHALLDPARKSAYDRELQARLHGNPAPAIAAAPIAALPPKPASTAAPVQHMVVHVPLPGQATASAAAPAAVQVQVPPTEPKPADASAPAPTKSPRFVIPQPVKIALGGMAGLFLGYFVVYFLTGRDLLGILPGGKSRKPTQVAAGNAPSVQTNGRPPSSEFPERPSPSRPEQRPSFPAPSFRPADSPGTQNSSNPPAAKSGNNAASPFRPRPPSQIVTSPPVKPNLPSNSPSIVVSGSNSIPPPNSAPLPGTTPSTPAPPKPKQKAPSPDEQKAMLAELQSIYDAEFERGSKADGRQEFVAFLLTTARKLKSDPVAQFVLFREAYDRALRLEDFVTAANVVDELERGFEVDGFRLRMHLLTEAARAAKSPEERAPLVLFALDMADYALATQRPEDVSKLANSAEGLARNIPNREVKTQTTARCIELRKAAEDLVPVTSARAKLETDPADPAASLIYGKYRCFVEGDWAEGLKLLAQSNDPTLSAAAKLDLESKAGDKQAAISIGDVWFDLAMTDPSLAPAFARARHWYQQAQGSADGLEKVKLDKRIEQISAMNLPAKSAESANHQKPLANARYLLTRMKAFAPTNLIPAITPQTVRTQGWNIYTDTLRVDSDALSARLQSPVNPTGEYQVGLRVRRYTSSPNSGMFVIGLPHVRSQFLVVIDYAVPGKGYSSFITLSGLKRPEDNPTLKVTENAIPRIGMNQEHIIICAVKLDEISVLMDGQPLIQYKGDMSKLTMTKEWAVPDTRSMFLGAHQGGFYVHGWVVSPLVADDGTQLPLITDPREIQYGPQYGPNRGFGAP